MASGIDWAKVRRDKQLRENPAATNKQRDLIRKLGDRASPTYLRRRELAVYPIRGGGAGF